MAVKSLRAASSGVMFVKREPLAGSAGGDPFDPLRGGEETLGERDVIVDPFHVDDRLSSEPFNCMIFSPVRMPVSRSKLYSRQVLDSLTEVLSI